MTGHYCILQRKHEQNKHGNSAWMSIWLLTDGVQCISYLCVGRRPQFFKTRMTLLHKLHIEYKVKHINITQSLWMQEKKGRKDGVKAGIRKLLLRTVGAEEASLLVALGCYDELKRIQLHICAAVLWNVTNVCFGKKRVHHRHRKAIRTLLWATIALP